MTRKKIEENFILFRLSFFVSFRVVRGCPLIEIIPKRRSHTDTSLPGKEPQLDGRHLEPVCKLEPESRIREQHYTLHRLPLHGYPSFVQDGLFPHRLNEGGNMGRMLNLLESVVTRARQLQDVGRTHDALSLLRRHANQPELPAPMAAETHHLMGELCLNLQQHRQARKHLATAIRLQPRDATVHHMMANAIDRDPEIDAQAASRYYRSALELAPNDPALLTDAGLFHVDMGRSGKGLTMLRLAVELAPDDMNVLQSLLVALGELDRFDDARTEINAARFRHARNPQFLKLVSDLEFQETRRQQKKSRPVAEVRDPADAAILPFRELAADEIQKKKPAKRFVRHDAASASRPHLGKATRQTDSPRAQ
jgi:Flp pilus assembly protein TadD